MTRFNVPIHDWQHTYSSVEIAERDLEGFKYSIDGWYITTHPFNPNTIFDVLLAIKEGDELFIWCWNHRDPRKDMHKLLSLPEFRNKTD